MSYQDDLDLPESELSESTLREKDDIDSPRIPLPTPSTPVLPSFIPKNTLTKLPQQQHRTKTPKFVANESGPNSALRMTCLTPSFSAGGSGTRNSFHSRGTSRDTGLGTSVRDTPVSEYSMDNHPYFGGNHFTSVKSGLHSSYKRDHAKAKQHLSKTKSAPSRIHGPPPNTPTPIDIGQDVSFMMPPRDIASSCGSRPFGRDIVDPKRPHTVASMDFPSKSLNGEFLTVNKAPVFPASRKPLTTPKSMKTAKYAQILDVAKEKENWAINLRSRKFTAKSQFTYQPQTDIFKVAKMGQNEGTPSVNGTSALESQTSGNNHQQAVSTQNL